MADLAGRRVALRITDIAAIISGGIGLALLIDGTLAQELGRLEAVWVIVLMVGAAVMALMSSQHRNYERLQLRTLEMLCNNQQLPRQSGMNGTVRHLSRDLNTVP